MSFASGSSTGRGGYAPRRGRGGWSRPFIKRQVPAKPDIVTIPLGDILASVQSSDLALPPTELPSSIGIENCQYVTSYNWVADKNSTIVVPGKCRPPRWTPLNVARKLPEDKGSFHRDPNAARYPEYPIAPAVQAVMTSKSQSPTVADIFACGSTLGNLLRFVRGGDKAFRFSVEVIGDTVFFIRKENDPKELIEGVRGFGHSFPDAYTTWSEDVKGSVTHQRIVQYDLGGITCLLRYECDGFLDNSDEGKAQQSTKEAPLSTDELTEALSSTTISLPKYSSTDSLSVKQAGKPIDQASIFDLKTRSGRHHKSIKMDDITPQLWVKQIPNFIVAYHDGYGLFEDIQIQDVRPLIFDFEKDNSDAIRRLIVLLNKIIAIATADEKRLLEVYFSGQGALEIRRQFGAGVHALPETLREQWIARAGQGGLKLEYGDDTQQTVAAGPSLSDEPRYDFGDFGDSDEEKDFTACSADECGYCGRCTY
ncbi:hypothetical protein E8E11_007412 [Didymella keratinophila]|nr:hypothetical protein E8E11_007412 [Didymella keratinophila]